MKKKAYLKKANDFKIIFVFCLMGFVSGLPYALVSGTLQSYLIQEGLSIVNIGYLGMVSLPYALKPLWAVGIDWLRGQGSMGCVSVYLFSIFLCAFSMSVLTTWATPGSLWFILLAFFATFASATIDICVDSMRILYVDEPSQGDVTAWFVIAYRVAFILSGGMALGMADVIGWDALYQCMSALLCAVGVVSAVLFQLLVYRPARKRIKANYDFMAKIKQWLDRSHRDVVSAVLFIFAFKFHGVFLASCLQVFLQKELMLSLTFIGLTYKTFGMAATFTGGLFAGWLSRHFSLARCVEFTLVLQMMAVFVFLVVHGVSPSWQSTVVSLPMFMESFCLGTSTTLVTLIITKQCSRDLAATQYAFFTAVIAWERTLMSPLGAIAQDLYGWDGYFLLSLASVPVVIILLRRSAPMIKSLCVAPKLEY